MKKCLLAAALTCLTSTVSSLSQEVVNVYSQRHYPADQENFAKFTAQTGIKVNVVKGSADELIDRLKSEGKASPADVLITKDAGRIHRAITENLLQAADSAVLQKQVPAYLREDKNRWFAITQRARVIAYAKDRVNPAHIARYEDLAKPAMKGRVLARSSSNIYNQSLLASMISHHGQEKALLWAAQVRKNMARAPQGSDRDQIRAIAAGVGDVAIVNTYYLGLLANSDKPKDRQVASKVALVFPNQSDNGTGTHMNISAAGITKHASNKANAIKFLEFMTSQESQAFYAAETFEYPISLKLTTDMHKSWGSFKHDTLHLSELGKNNALAVKLFQAAQWE